MARFPFVRASDCHGFNTYLLNPQIRRLAVRPQDGEEEHKVVVAAPPSSAIALLLVCIGRSPLHVARGTLVTETP